VENIKRNNGSSMFYCECYSFRDSCRRS